MCCCPSVLVPCCQVLWLVLAISWDRSRRSIFRQDRWQYGCCVCYSRFRIGVVEVFSQRLCISDMYYPATCGVFWLFVCVVALFVVVECHMSCNSSKIKIKMKAGIAAFGHENQNRHWRVDPSFDVCFTHLLIFLSRNRENDSIVDTHILV